MYVFLQWYDVNMITCHEKGLKIRVETQADVIIALCMVPCYVGGWPWENFFIEVYPTTASIYPSFELSPPLSLEPSRQDLQANPMPMSNDRFWLDKIARAY